MHVKQASASAPLKQNYQTKLTIKLPDCRKFKPHTQKMQDSRFRHQFHLCPLQNIIYFQFFNPLICMSILLFLLPFNYCS